MASGSPSAGGSRNRKFAPAEQQCATGVAIYETISALPPETAAKAMVGLLREAFGPGQSVGG